MASYVYWLRVNTLGVEENTWSRAFTAGTTPAARSRHTANLIGNRIFFFGGGDDSRVFNDLHVLDTGVWNMWVRKPLVKCGRRHLRVGQACDVWKCAMRTMGTRVNCGRQ